MKITYPLMFSVCMVFLIISIQPLPGATPSEQIFTAIQDARRDAGSDAYQAVLHARKDAAEAAACIWHCAPLAYTVAAFQGNVVPTPPTYRFAGKSYEYIDIYLREYRKAAQNSRLKKMAIGHLIVSLFSAFVLIIVD